MEQSKLYKKLQNPKIFGSDVKSVDILQTHISFVVLTGKYAYKIKKSVNFGFLDFSTLEKRKYFCEEEIRLNKRLCPDIYLDVIPITIKNDDLELNGDGEIIEYALKMKEFSQDKIMTNLIKAGKINEKIIDEIVEILDDFYKNSETSDEINKFGTIELIKKNTDENFEQTKDVIDLTISKQNYNFIKNKTDNFLIKEKNIFNKRIESGYIHDCHGDLHSGNIVIDDKVIIFDCIEFNKRFRYSDLACDIAYLCMDLDMLGYPYLSSYLIEKYIEKSQDKDIIKIINFYKAYRAYVRAKVIGFKLNDPNIGSNEKKNVIKDAQSYFNLSLYYTKLFSLESKKKKPILFITSGLTGTGKTTIARKFSIDYNANVISTDMIRKEIAGIDKFERHHDDYNTGLYSPDKMMQTYEKIFEKAENLLKKGTNVILDGTFKTQKLRKKALDIAERNNSSFIILYCNCPEENVKKYLDERVKNMSVSDGRWEIYQKQKDSFEEFKNDELYLEIDISNNDYEYQNKIFNKIYNKICEG